MSTRLARRLISLASAVIWTGATFFALAALPTPVSVVLAVFLFGIAVGTIGQKMRSVWRRLSQTG